MCCSFYPILSTIQECVALLIGLYKKKWCSFMCWKLFSHDLGTLWKCSERKPDPTHETLLYNSMKTATHSLGNVLLTLHHLFCNKSCTQRFYRSSPKKARLQNECDTKQQIRNRLFTFHFLLVMEWTEIAQKEDHLQ